MFFPLYIIKLKTGIAAGVFILALLSMGLVSVPDTVWFPIVQISAFTLLLFGVSPSLKMFGLFEWITHNGLIGALIISAVFVFFINLIQSLFGHHQQHEPFLGDKAIGRTPFKPPNPFCPPKLDFSDPIDTDTERQTPSCIANPNELTEEQQLDEIDIYLRDSQESIARITGYLNIARPDERWLSKKEMDNPNNHDIAKNFRL